MSYTYLTTDELADRIKYDCLASIHFASRIDSSKIHTLELL